jgi:hypothetical protein
MNQAALRANLIMLMLGCSSIGLGETHGVGHTSQLNFQTTYLQKPNDPATYQTTQQTVGKLLWRENLTLNLGNGVSYHANGYLLTQELSENDEVDKFVLQSSDPRNRSSVLEHHFQHTDRHDSLWAVDRLSVAVRWESLRLTIGRFPIDLSRTFIFRPNDFFGPFRSYQFDRSHKLGVDAMELAMPIEPLGDLRFISVAGYESTSAIVQDPWQRENRFAARKTSSLLYHGNTYHGIYGAVFAGKLFEDMVYGGVAEGEVDGMFGYHLDFHQKYIRADQRAITLVAVGGDRQLGDNTLAQFELFYNGDEAGLEESRSSPSVADPFYPRPYRGSLYSALVLSHSFVDLSDLKGLLQSNFDDESWLATLYVKKPITQSFDMTLAANVKGGLPPVEGEVKSEFGAYPHTLNFEMSAYF